MRLIIEHQGRRVAIIAVTDVGALEIEAVDPQFSSWSDRLRAGDISMFHDVHEQQQRKIVRTVIEPRDPVYPLAIKQYLERHGFDVTIEDPELDQAVLRAVQALPDTFPGKAEVLREVPTLTTLEKTALLERLQRAG